MVIKYEITPEDLQQYCKETVSGMTVYRLYTIILVAITVLFMLADMLLAVAAIGYNDGSIKVESFNVLPRFVIAFVISGIIWLILRIYAKRAMSKITDVPGKNGQFCEHAITLDDNGFTEETEVNRNFHSWAGVEKITETENNVIIQIRLGAGYFIPKRSFRDPSEIHSFMKAVEDHVCQSV